MAAALLALAADALVGADAATQALLARAPDAVMLAYLRSPAFLAPALDALVGAYARPQALLALAPLAVMLAYLRSPRIPCTSHHPAMVWACVPDGAADGRQQKCATSDLQGSSYIADGGRSEPQTIYDLSDLGSCLL